MSLFKDEGDGMAPARHTEANKETARPLGVNPSSMSARPARSFEHVRSVDLYISVTSATPDISMTKTADSCITNDRSVLRSLGHDGREEVSLY